MWQGMKKIIVLLLCALFLCGCNAENKKETEKPCVVTTIFPIYDFVRAVGGDRVDIIMLIKPGTEVHSYDPVPSEIKSIYNSDLFFYIGGESDEWVNKILADKSVNSYALIECVNPILEENHKEYDEHIWTSPENARKMLDKILAELVKADPENSEYYRQNHLSYVDKINQIEQKTKEMIEKSTDPFILVADKFPFKYFADYYEIDYLAAADGCAIGTDISLKTMTELLNAVNDKNLKCVYYVEMSNKEIANSVSEQTGVKLLELHSAHNVTLEDFEKGVTYVDIAQRNYDSLKEGIG